MRTSGSRTTRASNLLVLAVLALVVAAGCGDDDDSHSTAAFCEQVAQFATRNAPSHLMTSSTASPSQCPPKSSPMWTLPSRY